MRSAAAIILLLATSSLGVEVSMRGEWVQSRGWRVTCSWLVPASDRLQSVRLHRDLQQFFIYRPEKDGLRKEYSSLNTESILKVRCDELEEKGRVGKCVIDMEPRIEPNHNSSFLCEVSGEGPMFLMKTEEFNIADVVVPPSDALFEFQETLERPQNRATLNCSASGFPAPSLYWSIGDQKSPADFNGRHWNTTTKLWEVWSTLSYTIPSEHHRVMCTPQVKTRTSYVKGRPAMYNAAPSVFGNMLVVTIALITILCR